MGLLYGNGDPTRRSSSPAAAGCDSRLQSVELRRACCSRRLGFSKLPDRFYRKLDEKTIFSHTAYNFPALLDVCEKLARQAVVRSGGRIEKDADGEEVFVIPVAAPKPSKFEDLKHPGPIAGSRFTEEEMAQIKAPGTPAALARPSSDSPRDGRSRTAAPTWTRGSARSSAARRTSLSPTR